MTFQAAYRRIYQQKQSLLTPCISPFSQRGRRPHSIAIAGGAFGDEGKGRIVDELTHYFLESHPEVMVYRDNGGSNAGHTVKIGDTKLGLHQIGSGVLHKGCINVLGKGMVINPQDLVSELQSILTITNSTSLPSVLQIDENATLCLDTHRVMEAVLKVYHTKRGIGATGRGIAPAYADIIYRHPLKIRDLYLSDAYERISHHYLLYTKLVRGFGVSLAKAIVPSFKGSERQVGSKKVFITSLLDAASILKPFVRTLSTSLRKTWRSNTPIIFEKAQAIGLDQRYGVYPDVTASNCSFDGISFSFHNHLASQDISCRALVIKATYMSSVGSRTIPTMMPSNEAGRIRKDAHEFGTTSGRPRDIAYLDLPMLTFFRRVSDATHLIVTHLDIAYQEPIKICTHYEINGKKVHYLPDQDFLNQVKPIYKEIPSFDSTAVTRASSVAKLPINARRFISLLSSCLELPILMITTGPDRHQSILNF